MMRRFELVRGGEVLGVVTRVPEEGDFPWHGGRFEPSLAYGEVGPLFDEMARIVEHDGFDEESGRLCERIMAPGIWLRALDDGALLEVSGITIEGKRVHWRDESTAQGR